MCDHGAMDFGHLELIACASSSIFVGVHGCLFKAIATKYLAAALVGQVGHLQLIVSLAFSNTQDSRQLMYYIYVHLWIEEDLIYTGMC